MDACPNCRARAWNPLQGGFCTQCGHGMDDQLRQKHGFPADHNQELVERVARAIALSDYPGEALRWPEDFGPGERKDYRDNARAAIAAAQPDGVWQPIETAPRDGTHILLATGDQVTIGRAVEDGRWFELNSDPTDYWDGELRAPDHWRPLPDPPALSAPEPVEEQKQ